MQGSADQNAETQRLNFPLFLRELLPPTFTRPFIDHVFEGAAHHATHFNYVKSTAAVNPNPPTTSRAMACYGETRPLSRGKFFTRVTIVSHYFPNNLNVYFRRAMLRRENLTAVSHVRPLFIRS
jgi:hypothetical protein